MARTANEVLTHHINAMMTMDFENAPSDYSEDLKAITRLDNRNRTMGYDSLKMIMDKGIKITSKIHLNMDKMAGKLHEVFRMDVGEYVVFLAEMKPYSDFACFNYIVHNDKAVYVTGFAKAPFFMPSIGIPAHPFAPGTATMKVMDAHLSHLRERNAELLLSDYADDAIVITNLSKKPFVGKEEIKAYCRLAAGKASVNFGAIAGPDTKYILKDSVDELGCIGFQQKKTKQYGVFTQRVRNGKIIYESAIFRGAEALL